ncbi:MAG: potassium channel family protein [Muribaculaceae bacterium]|nr:potassium channel family protein [Muribaculaceae bacterium]
MNHVLQLTQKWTYRILHMFVLVLSVFLVVSISIDSFRGQGIEFYDQPRFLKTQVVICAVFLLDFFAEFFMSDRKGHYFITHFLFLLVSIPYLWIIHKLGFDFFSPKAAYLLQYIPLARGGYALAMVVGWITSNRATGLFVTYLITLMSTVYFASLVFFMFEQGVNPQVSDYTDALWWAAMDVTTVGSNISPVSPEGRILAVVVAALGMMMFPIFTVYVTSLITRKHNSLEAPDGSGASTPSTNANQ